MLYRFGARDEVSGKTGLAHFLEHMAFRDTENFPNTDVVSRIYAVGGEWHGYTWTDQTTYFSTVPREHLDLLLRIEADRMSRLKLDKKHMEAERGSVLAEMHMYENLPTSMLIDAVNYLSFLAHPYRNNTIGWESDIENLQHADVVEFYERHYQPANAVLAVVGDFERSDVRKRVEKLFGTVPGKVATPLPHTIEPPQKGLRRVTLRGPHELRQFMIAYRSPSVVSPNFAAFLVLQEILGAGSGINFLQNDWGTPVDDGSLLAGTAHGLTTWYPPSAQDYVFIIGGEATGDDTESVIEQRIESRIASLREMAPTRDQLEDAISNVQDALIFDVQTTEDAAHQLAFFDGLNALDTLLSLPERVAAVSAADVQRVAARYLGSEQRSIAWYLPAPGNDDVAAVEAVQLAPAIDIERPLGDPGERIADRPIVRMLSGGIPVILQHSDLSSTAFLQIVLPGTHLAGAVADAPINGHSAISRNVTSQHINDAIRKANDTYRAIQPVADLKTDLSFDPATRMEQEFAGLMQVSRLSPASRVAPSLITVVGDIDVDRVFAELQNTFGDIRKVEVVRAKPVPFSGDPKSVSIGKPVAQAQMGYIAGAPGPGDPRSDAWRLLLYILSHDYEGRLGKKAITESGLVYYIGSNYRSDGENAWVTLSTGVDTSKIAPFGALLSAELDRLQTEPPTITEIEEAKNHRLGRLQSAAQSNSELATQLATQWLWYGEIHDASSLQKRLDAISRQDVLDEIAAFTSGMRIVVAE